MSQLLERAKGSSSARRSKEMGASLLPQVNLLPLEIAEARNFKRLKIMLLIIVAAAVGVAIFATLISTGLVVVAENALEKEQQRTVTLQTEQRKYAEVPIVLRQWDETNDALFRASMGDVAWQPVISAISDVTKDIAVSQFVVESWSALDGFAAPSDPAQNLILSRIAFETVSEERPDAVAWMQALETTPGFTDIRVVSIEAEGAGDDLRYKSVLSVSIQLDVASGRFIPKELES